MRKLFVFLILVLSCAKQPTQPEDRPVIPNLTIEINKDSVNLGETFVLGWKSDAVRVVIDNGIGERSAPNGQEIVSISDTNRVGWNVFNVTAFSTTNHSIQKSDSVFVRPIPIRPEDQVFELSPVLSIKGDQSKLGVVTFNIHRQGEYKIEAEVWYNSGDQQRNESFYITLGDVFPLDPNAGIYKVVPDVAGEHFGIPRNCGTFSLEIGTYSIDVFHYGLISHIYPQFLNGPIDVDSVKITAFKIIYVGN